MNNLETQNTESLEQARIACDRGEYGKASLLLTNEAEKGDPEALFLLGSIIVEGKGQVLTEQKGISFLKKSAELGFLPAIYRVRQLANKKLYFFWRDDAEAKEDKSSITLKSNKQAYHRLNIATVDHSSKLKFYPDNLGDNKIKNLSSDEQNKLYTLAVGGEVSAMYDLSLYLRHSLKKSEESSGLFWLERAAQKGSAQAQYELGKYCLEGTKVSKDVLQACLWFKRATEKDYVPAIYALASVYIDKSLGLYNPIEGVSLLKRIKEQCPNALILLARLAFKGDIFPQDEVLARNYLEQASKMGSEQASFELAKLLVKQQQIREGVELLDLASRKNNIDAIVLLADLYQQGLGVAKLEDKAAFLYYKAACMGSADAQYKFAQTYLSSTKVEDICRGELWCYKASCSKHTEALRTYGIILKRKVDKKLGLNFEHIEKEYQHSQSEHKTCYYAEYKQAFDFLLSAAEAGDAKAQFVVASMYYNGLGVKSDLNTAVFWYKKAAVGGNIDAQFRMAELYNYGNILEKNLEQSAEWYRSAASNGSVVAAYQLGLMYRDGRGVGLSRTQAFKYFKQAAKFDYAPAIRELGRYMLSGLGEEENFEQAVLYLRQAALKKDEDAVIELVKFYCDHGYKDASMQEAIHLLETMVQENRPSSTYLLAQCNFNGVGMEVNVAKGLELLDKAAQLNSSIAQYDLGMLYYEGRLVPCDYQRAISFLRKAAMQNYVKAQYMMGKCARDGLGMLVNYLDALHYFKASANQGYSLAYLALGEMYEHGIGVISSCKEALYYYRLLAYSDYNEAFLLIANILLKGNGDVLASPEEAAQWLLKGVEKGHSGCCYRLALLHLENKIESADVSMGLKLINKAAELDNCDALYYLAQAYSEGVVLPVSQTKAFFYCQKAASLNHVKATTMLGLMCLKGQGCEPNVIMAYDLFSTAANMGDGVAQYELALLFKCGTGVKQSFIDAYVWSILALTSDSDIKQEATTLRDEVAMELTSGQLKTAQYIASERFNNMRPNY